MNDRRDQYICAALTGVLNADGLPAEGYEKQYAKCVVEIADFALAAAGEKDSFDDADVTATMATLRRGAEGYKEQAEFLRSRIVDCERERDEMHASLERGTSALAACERERDALRRESDCYRNLTNFLSDNGGHFDQYYTIGDFTWDAAISVIKGQELVIALLKRQAEPLTEDEAKSVTALIVGKLGASVTGVDGHLLAIAYADAADRFRARRA